MPRPRRWSDLLPGVLALAALVGGVVAVLVFARVGGLHGDKIRLYATVAEARGLSAGSEVWLAGERIGVVDAIGFLPPTADTSQRLLLSLSVLQRHREMIRRGTPVRLEAGGNFIGAPVVAIELGSASAPAVRDGDTLHAVLETDTERLRAEFQHAASEVPVILANVRVLAAQLRAAGGTLGALGLEGRASLTATANLSRETMAAARTGNGTVGRVLGGRGGPAMHARRALARTDSLRLLLADGGPRSLGRLARDSTLLREVESIRAELARSARLLDEPRGTAGRLQHDSALVREVARARAEVGALVADLKRNPLRYLAF